MKPRDDLSFYKVGVETFKNFVQKRMPPTDENYTLGKYFYAITAITLGAVVVWNKGKDKNQQQR